MRITRRDDLRKHQFRANLGTGVLGVGFLIAVLGISYLVSSGIGLSTPDRGYVIDRHHVAGLVDGPDLHVTERIDATYLEPRRGIVRDLPTAAPHRGEALVYDDIVVVSASHPEVPVAVTTFTDLVEVRIGDPARTITGSADYLLQYTIRGLAADDDGDATVRWDALLYDWDTTVVDAAISLTAPTDGGATVACVFGRIGGTTTCPSPTTDGATTIWTFDRSLRHREGATVEAVLVDEPVDDLPPSTLGALDASPFRFDLILGVLAIVPVAAAIVGVQPRTRRRIRSIVDDAKVTFQPPRGMDPATAAATLERRPDPVDGYLATILHLAARGHLRLRRPDSGSLLASAEDPDAAPARHRDLVRGLTTSHAGSRTTSRLDRSASIAGTFAAFQRSYPAHVIPERWGVRRLLGWLIVGGCMVFVVGQQVAPFITPGAGVPPGVVHASVAVAAAALGYGLHRWQRRATAPHLAAIAPDVLRHLIGYRSFLAGHAGTLEFAAEDAGVDLGAAYLQHLPYAVAFGESQAWIDRYGPVAQDVDDWVPTTHDEFDSLHTPSRDGYRARRRELTRQRDAAARSGSASGRASTGAGGRGGGSGGGGGRGRSW
ncbi:MAG: DUF2207 domain-containing protein [Nitriliruptoraceae bacterium]|nr:DUF2207 domain-containing protein [Nitriliruptoraceae bacterium]